MLISRIDIHNFRKLKCCRVELASKETVFVGANNSGKTSAMDAVMLFLKKSRRTDICTTDFTLSNWNAINSIGEDWVKMSEETTPDIKRSKWESLLPCIDVWLCVGDNEIHYVSHLIPTLDWSGGPLGVRLILEPKKVEDLYKAFKAAYSSAKSTTESRAASAQEGTNGNGRNPLNLWPQSMREFLDKELHKHFTIHGYILDPSKCYDATPQALPEGSEPIEGDPFDGLIKIDIINAQRGFSDPNSGDASSNTDRRLSAQLRQYYDNHLDPTEFPESSDLDALEAIEAARAAFDAKLKNSFRLAITELEGLNYPGFSNPQVILSSKINPLEGLKHDSAVQFNVLRNAPSSGTLPLCLPEKYNGLGYQNLISMVFNLIRFRDEWMRVGKAGKRVAEADNFIEPLHLVLIEEPEAHLHAQVQQVFIKKAYGVLRNNEHLLEKDQFRTQLVVSTHSSHIAHEIDFTSLRYFKRIPTINGGDVPCATVVNLTTTFGSDDDSSRFATRYLKTTHCDLFFADAAILVEGPAERMLIPHFITSKYPDLDKSYISLLEIGGSHAHRLKPLIETLGLLTLVVTDLDSIGTNKSGKKLPKKGESYTTGNDTIKSWVPGLSDLDSVIDAPDESKVTTDNNVRVAYQCSVSLPYQDGTEEDAIPYTFEDALVLSNLDLFRAKSDSTGLLKKMSDAVSREKLSEACRDMFEALCSGKKAEMALELLFTTEPRSLNPPKYIAEGLAWLDTRLRPQFDNNTDDRVPGGGEA